MTPIDRRRFLRLAGAATAATLAGCEGDITHRELSADPVGLSKTGYVDLGYPGVTTTTESRTVTTSVGEDGFVLDLTDHVYVYGTGAGVDRPLGVLATPRASVAGGDRNPVATNSPKDLVAGEHGRGLLHALGVGSGPLSWTTAPRSTTPTRTAGTSFGTTADVETFVGRISDGSTTYETAVNVARATNGDDAVVAAVVQHYPESQGIRGKVFGVGDPGLGEEVLELALQRLKPNPTTSIASPVNISLSDPKLVQNVSDTHLLKPGTPIREPDPPLVEQRYTAPLFDLSVPGRGGFPPLFVSVGLDVAGNPGEMRVRLTQSDVQDVGQGAETEAVLHDAARTSDPDTDLPVFQIFPHNDAVTMRAEAPSGYDFDSATIRKGSDYSVESARNLRVGFITVHDPGDGSNYGGGNGRPSTFRRSVDACVDYLRRAYPGGLYAYRHDDAIKGYRKLAGPDGDYRKARRALEGAAQGAVFGGGGFPGAGELFTRGGTRTDAEVKIKNNGFDVWVLIVPAGYYSHHYDDPPTGLFPGSHNQAVSAYEAAVIGNRGCPTTVAQEIGHFFADEPYKERRNWPSHIVAHPLAQRDDDGADTYLQGKFGVDQDHARHQNSRLDPEGGVDNFGLVSTGYDLADGQFTVVNDFDMSGATFGAGSTNGSGGNRSVEQVASYMSYAGGATWADSRIHRDLISANYGSQRWSNPGPIFEGEGHVDEDGRVVYDEVYATRGKVYVGGDISDAGETDRGVAGPGGDEAVDNREPVGDDREAVGDDREAVGDDREAVGDDREPVGHGGDVTDGQEADGEPAEVTVHAPDGEVLDQRTVPTSVSVEHHVHDEVNAVEAVVRFPTAAATVRTRRGDLETEVNPVTRSLRDAVGRLPERAFAEDRAGVEEAVGAALEEVATLMETGAYADARELLVADVRPVLESGLAAEVETGAATRDRGAMLQLVDELGERLAVLSEY